MTTIGKYLKVELLPKPEGRKTDIWSVFNKTDDYLGSVQWYPQWRQYIFSPEFSFLNSTCLDDISEFLKKQTELFRQPGPDSRRGWGGVKNG